MNWLFIAFALVTQEVVSLNAMIFEVNRYHFHVWFIHVLFIIATLFDIVVGFLIGKYTRKKLVRGKVFAFAEKWSAKFHSYVGTRGRRFALLLIGNFSFPYINAFIAAWLDMPFVESLIFLFIGNMIWYGSLWLLVLGITSAIPNPWMALGVIVSVALLVTVAARKRESKKVAVQEEH